MKLTYPACFYPDEERDGAFAVVVPDLPGCVSGGDTLADAIIMGTDAASGWVLDELEDGKTAPKASTLDSITPDPGGFVSMLVLDMDSYAEKYGSKAIRKNVTIPAWLNTFAEANHINFSKTLQNSLTELYQQQFPSSPTPDSMPSSTILSSASSFSTEPTNPVLYSSSKIIEINFNKEDVIHA